MSGPHSSRARERYLMAIAKRQRQRQAEDQVQGVDAAVAMGELAEALAVTPGTATTMVRRLAEQGLVAYTPYAGVALTAAGRKQALTLVRRHRLLECFLVEVLGYDWSDVHDEAERLEHGVSETLLARIDAHLGHPGTDPHGNPIPTAAGELARDDAIALAHCPAGAAVRFARIGALSPAFLALLAEHGWGPGVKGRVADSNAVAETVTIAAGRKPPITMSRGAAEQIFVQREAR